MVSKIILVSVAVVALVSMVQATTTPVNYAPCIQSVMYVQRKSNISIDIDLSGLLKSVFGILDSVLSGVLNFVNNLLGGLLGGGSSTPFVPAPKNFGLSLQLILGYAKVLDAVIALQIPSFPKGLITRLYVSLVINRLLNVNIDLGSFKSQYGSYVQTDDVLKSDCQKALALINVGVFSGDLLNIGIYLKELLGLINLNIGVNVLPRLIGNLIRLHVGIAGLSGYPNYGSLIDINIQLFNGYFNQYQWPTINPHDYTPIIKQNCKCLKRN